MKKKMKKRRTENKEHRRKAGLSPQSCPEKRRQRLPWWRYPRRSNDTRGGEGGKKRKKHNAHY